MPKRSIYDIHPEKKKLDAMAIYFERVVLKKSLEEIAKDRGIKPRAMYKRWDKLRDAVHTLMPQSDGRDIVAFYEREQKELIERRSKLEPDDHNNYLRYSREIADYQVRISEILKLINAVNVNVKLDDRLTIIRPDRQLIDNREVIESEAYEGDDRETGI